MVLGEQMSEHVGAHFFAYITSCLNALELDQVRVIFARFQQRKNELFLSLNFLELHLDKNVRVLVVLGAFGVHHFVLVELDELNGPLDRRHLVVVAFFHQHQILFDFYELDVLGRTWWSRGPEALAQTSSQVLYVAHAVHRLQMSLVIDQRKDAHELTAFLGRAASLAACDSGFALGTMVCISLVKWIMKVSSCTAIEASSELVFIKLDENRPNLLT
ncbi:hypothetical protein BpHYR1_051879 [Brachionus plicatilis]|uniref:Uncharacterized protein n=1 Tax=Brachionus plicatilis TaxID=10195 RepID=A0A3M7RLT1_BRAPC|nr:hypothetical protein BpHYR1_051879 [Brachionus plicatilis]